MTPPQKPPLDAAEQGRLIRLLVATLIGMLGVALLFGALRGNLTTSRGVSTVPPPPYVFPAVEAQFITRIELESRATGRKIVLIKTPGDWQGQDGSGKAFAVDLTRMPGLLQILASMRYNRIIDDSGLEKFGLADGGRFVVRFICGDSYELHVGDENPDQSLVYVQRSGEDRVLLVSAEPVAIMMALVEAGSAP